MNTIMISAEGRTAHAVPLADHAVVDSASDGASDNSNNNNNTSNSKTTSTSASTSNSSI